MSDLFENSKILTAIKSDISNQKIRDIIGSAKDSSYIQLRLCHSLHRQQFYSASERILGNV